MPNANDAILPARSETRTSVGELLGHLAEIELDAGSLEMITAALTVEACDGTESADR